MIWIHLTAGAGLLIWFFQVRKKTENHSMVRRIFWIAATGNLLGAAFTLAVNQGAWNRMTETVLERGAFGSRPEEEDWTVLEEDGGSHQVTVVVPPREYKREEVKKLFSAAIELLDETIAGDNTSLSYVNRPLNLITKIPDSPVSVSWNTDKPLLVDSRGMLSDEIPKEGAKVTLEGELEVQGETEQYIRTIQVYPCEKDEEEQFLAELYQAMEEQNADDSDPEYHLPSSVNGKKLLWQRSADPVGIQLLALSMIAAVCYGAAAIQEKERRMRAKEAQMRLDYPEIVSEMALLLEAGLSMRSIIERMAQDYRRQRENGLQRELRYAYEELWITWKEMENGVPEQEAYERMGERCALGIYRSLVTLLVQNLKKGSKGLLELLKRESQEALENRERMAKAAGETAGAKLILPMGMMLAVVLIILTVPAFLSFYA